jgi:hypothetical protein
MATDKTNENYSVDETDRQEVGTVDSRLKMADHLWTVENTDNCV